MSKSGFIVIAAIAAPPVWKHQTEARSRSQVSRSGAGSGGLM